MSTPTATTLPEVCGATSVCWSPARLPVASKKRGRSRLIAAAVVTSTTTGCVFAAVSSFLTLAFEPPHDAMNALAATSSRIKTNNFKFPLDRICLYRNSVQQNVSELLCRTLVADVQQATIRVPKIVVERLVHHHADKATHHDRGIDFRESSVALSLADVSAEKLVDATHILVEEHFRELVFFEC